MAGLRVLFFGSGEFAIPTFRSLRSDGHAIVGVVSQPPRPAGRGKALQPTPLAAFASEAGFDVLTPADVNAPQVLAGLRELRADLGYVAAFGQKLGADLLTMFPVGIINLHGSLLPAWRGAAPVQRAVLNGDRETGVTIFRIVEKMDAGPILAQRRTAIVPDETADDLLDRLARIGCDCLRAALERLAANPGDPGDPQDPAGVTLAPKLRKSDGYADFSLSPRRAAARINGLWSWPAAACRFISADGRRDEAVLIARARPAEMDAPSADPPGVVSGSLRVAVTGGEIELLEVRPVGGRLMDWQSFVNGRHVKPGDRFIGGLPT